MTDNSNPSIEEVNCVDVPSSVETDKYKSYIDENMNSHVVDVDKVLGRGGQGIVYRTEDPNIALKLALKDSNEITDPSINGIVKNNISVIEYIGCLTIPYSPVSTTF